MSVPSRLDRYIETEKQRHFPRDFMVGWEAYETWEEATVGQSGPAQRAFKITEEDILDYNRACGETKPYLQMLLDFRNEKGILKARWWCSLILPETRADVARFANA
jgi:hypothetical protein